MKIVELDNVLVNEKATIKETMGVIDRNGLGFAFIVDDNRYLMGMATDGDIRRSIIAGRNIESNIKDMMNTNPITAKNTLSDVHLFNLMNKHHVNMLPLLDENNIVTDFSFLANVVKKINAPDIGVHSKRDYSGLKKILVIGGAGFIGSVLVRKLLDRGYKVRILDNLTYGEHGVEELYNHPDFEFVEGDIRDIQTVVNAVKGVDAAVHLAAIVGDPACALDAEETVEINYLASKMIAEVCKHHQINRLIFISTCSVYGASPGVLNEESSLNPVSLYAETKLRSEQGILSLTDENFSPCVLRLATVYGLSPRMRFDLVVNTLTARAIQDGEFAIFGGDQWRPNVHVQDVAESIITCFEAPIEKIKGEVYNVGSNEQNYQIYQIGDIVRKMIPNTDVNTISEEVDRRDYHVSFDKIYSNLGYKVQKSLEDGVTEIKELFEKGIVMNYADCQYNNYKFLSNQINDSE